MKVEVGKSLTGGTILVSYEDMQQVKKKELDMRHKNLKHY